MFFLLLLTTSACNMPALSCSSSLWTAPYHHFQLSKLGSNTLSWLNLNNSHKQLIPRLWCHHLCPKFWWMYPLLGPPSAPFLLHHCCPYSLVSKAGFWSKPCMTTDIELDHGESYLLTVQLYFRRNRGSWWCDKIPRFVKGDMGTIVLYESDASSEGDGWKT